MSNSTKPGMVTEKSTTINEKSEQKIMEWSIESVSHFLSWKSINYALIVEKNERNDLLFIIHYKRLLPFMKKRLERK